MLESLNRNTVLKINFNKVKQSILTGNENKVDINQVQSDLAEITNIIQSNRLPSSEIQEFKQIKIYYNQILQQMKQKKPDNKNKEKLRSQLKNMFLKKYQNTDQNDTNMVAKSNINQGTKRSNSPTKQQINKQQYKKSKNPIVSSYFQKYQKPTDEKKSFGSIIYEQVSIPSSSKFKKKDKNKQQKQQAYEQLKKLQQENQRLKQLYKSNKLSKADEKELDEKIQALQRNKKKLKQENQLLSEQLSVSNKPLEENSFDQDVFKAYAPYISYPLSNHLQQITSKKGSVSNYQIFKRQQSNQEGVDSKIKQLEKLQSYSQNKLDNNQLSGNLLGLKRVSSMKMDISQHSNNNQNYASSKKSQQIIQSRKQLIQSRNNLHSPFSRQKSSMRSSRNDMKLYERGKLPIGILDANTCSRNKIAFFKDTAMIVQDALIEVVIQKNQLHQDFRTQNCMISIKNLSPGQIKIDISYSNSERDYRIKRIEQIKQTIYPNTSSTELLEVQLLDKQEINSVVDVHLNVQWFNTYINEFVASKYQLWLPLTFINFPLYPSRVISPVRKKIQRIKIRPDEQFRTYEHAYEAGIPIKPKEQNVMQNSVTASIYGQSVFVNGNIKITWMSIQDMVIEGPPQWLALFAFIFSKYRKK